MFFWARVAELKTRWYTCRAFDADDDSGDGDTQAESPPSRRHSEMTEDAVRRRLFSEGDSVLGVEAAPGPEPARLAPDTIRFMRYVY